MTRPRKDLFVGTSNTVSAKNLIEKTFPSAEIFALGDATSSILIEATSKWGIKSSLSGKYFQSLFLDTLPNEFAFYYSGKISISTFEEIWVCCAEIITELNLQYACLLDLIPRQFYTCKEMYSFAAHRLQFIRSKLNKEIPLFRYSVKADDDYITGSDDGYHFTVEDYIKIYKSLRIASDSYLDQSLSSKIQDFNQQPALSKTIQSQSERILSFGNSIWIHGDTFLSCKQTTFSNSLHTCRGIEISNGEILEVLTNSTSPPNYIVFKSTESVSYLNIRLGEKTWHINCKTKVLPGKIIRCVNIGQALNQGLTTPHDIQANTGIKLSIFTSKTVHIDSVEIYHSNADDTEYCNDPYSPEYCEGVVIFSIGWTKRIAQPTVNLLPRPINGDKIEKENSIKMPSFTKDVAIRKRPEIFFDSFWPGFDPRHTIFNELLLKPSGATITSDIKSADLILTSVFCKDFDLPRNFARLKELSSAPILFYTGEHTNCGLGGRMQIENSLTPYDYILSHYVSSRPNTFWLPNYALGGSTIFSRVNNLWSNNRFRPDRQAKAVFCYSNPGQHFRNKIAEELDRREVLHSCGPLMNNTVSLAPRNIQEYGSYISNFRVVLAIENSSGACYTTEKLTNSLCGGTQVVYWGDPLAQQVVNPKSFYQITNYSLSEAIDLIMQLLSIDLTLDPDKAPFENPLYFEQLIRFGFERIRSDILG